MAGTRTSSARRLGIGGAVLGALAVVSWCAPHAVAAGPPSLTMTPGPTSRPYTDGQSIHLSVGPNSKFVPNTRIEVIECAAPNGTLPVDDSTCDGNTAQLGSVIVGPDGSFDVPAYTLYQLPNRVLGEQSNDPTVCNATHECVLYIGQDQNDFTQPKMFSPAFTVGSATPIGTGPAPSGGGPGPSGAGPGGTSGSANQSSGTGGSVSASAAVSLNDPAAGGASPVSAGVPAEPSGVLAFTGIAGLPWLLGSGALLMLIGSAGIHVRRRTEP